ncbi:MAG: SAM-dependent methyltransferase [Bacteroidetes bacterium]|nr:SAM-dependent methyltransferase [Bacteroidota bacterium]
MIFNISQNWISLTRHFHTFSQRKKLSPANSVNQQINLDLICNYCSGTMIDIGCGEAIYRTQVPSRVIKYETLDIEQRIENVDYVASVMAMIPIEDQQFDCGLCLEVLEHIENPTKALSEIYRILKNDSVLIVSVPHLSRIHEAPNDYFRFTQYGLRKILERTGFEIIEIKLRGGLFCFLGHQFSIIFLGICWSIPLVKNISVWLNYILVVRPAIALDTIFATNKLFPLGMTAVARKKRI